MEQGSGDEFAHDGEHRVQLLRVPAHERHELLELQPSGLVVQAVVDPGEIVQRDLQGLAHPGQAVQRDRLLAPLDLADELAAQVTRAAKARLAQAGGLRSWRIRVPRIFRVFVMVTSRGSQNPWPRLSRG